MTFPAESSTYKNMKVLAVKDVVRQNLAVDYIRKYDAKAVLEIMGSPQETKIEIMLEHSPLGGVDLQVKLLEDLSYPLLPALRAIKTSVNGMYERGEFS